MFVTLKGENTALAGILRLNETGVGIVIFSIEGSFDAPVLKIISKHQNKTEDMPFGQLSLIGKMNAKGEIQGDWQTTIGSAGTFVLFPHSGIEQINEIQQVEQFHTARHSFGAIEIDREQIIDIAESIQRDFPNVIVTVVAGTEQSHYLKNFKQIQFSATKAEIIKLFASKPDGSGYNQVVSMEFGPQVNSAMTQGASESWVIGRLETLKRDLKRYERTYVTNFKRWGIGINQFMLLCTIVFLPSLNDFGDRAILMIFVLALIAGIHFLHSRYVPFAAIHLGKKKAGLVGKFWLSFASWIIGIAATVMAALVGAYLRGWLKIPTSTP